MGERCYGPPDPIALGQALLGRDWRLWSRQPRPLDAYRAAGVRCVVTNARAQERYGGGPGAATDFPSFVRSYGELARPESLKVIDPAGWNGKGPVVLIHDPLSTGRAGADAPDGG